MLDDDDSLGEENAEVQSAVLVNTPRHTKIIERRHVAKAGWGFKGSTW